MEINSIANGVVIDHIRAGFGMKVLEYLNVDTKHDTVAFIMNAVSQKYGRKDIIKLENITDVDLAALGLIEHNATVNIIKDHMIYDKIKLSLPERVTNVIRCKNPRCVTSVEAVPHIFHLVNDSGMYSCEYCDNIVRTDEQ